MPLQVILFDSNRATDAGQVTNNESCLLRLVTPGPGWPGPGASAGAMTAGLTRPRRAASPARDQPEFLPPEPPDVALNTI